MKRPFNIRQFTIIKSVVMVMILGVISACGQKGPLYLPEQPKAAEKKQETSSTSPEKDEQKEKK